MVDSSKRRALLFFFGLLFAGAVLLIIFKFKEGGEMIKEAPQRDTKPGGDDYDIFKPPYKCEKKIDLFIDFTDPDHEKPCILRILNLDQQRLKAAFGADQETLDCLLLKATELKNYIDMMKNIEELRGQGTPEALSRADTLKRTLVEATLASQFEVTFVGLRDMLGGFEGIDPPPKCNFLDDF